MRCVTEPGDEVLTIAPYFPEYNMYVNMTGARLKVVPADTESFQIQFGRLEEMLTEKVAALLINTPNNPSGAVYSEDTLKKLAELLMRKQKEYGHDIFLISDEPYREIVFDGKKRLTYPVFMTTHCPAILIPSPCRFRERESAMWRQIRPAGMRS